LLAELNGEMLLQDPLEHRLLTISKRGKYLEQTVQLLESLRVGLRDFHDFYNWQRFWLNLPGNARKLIRALATIKPQDWPAAFCSWYLDQALLKYQDLALPQEMPPLQPFYALWDLVQQKLPEQVLALWDSRRMALQKPARANRELSNWLFGKGKKGKTEDNSGWFFSRFEEAYTEVFPLTLATTQAALEILEKAIPGHFEFIIGLEGRHIDTRHWHYLMPNGQRSALLGDFGTENPVVRQIDVPIFNLEAAHRNNPFNPFVPPPAIIPTVEDVQTSVTALHGFYEESLDVNAVEGEFLLDYLLNQLPMQFGPLAPSVAVVAFTRAQRDYIAAGLMRYKFSQGPEGDIVRQLERSGLAVLALGELDEIRSDIVLVSLVFNAWPGVLWGKHGHRTAAFAYRMQRLLAMPRREMVVCHSVPSMVLQAWQQSPVTSPEGFLGNFLCAASDVGKSDAIACLSALRPVPEAGLSEEAFWEALEEQIRPFFPKDRLRRRPAEGCFPASLELVPDNPNGQAVLLVADGFFGTLPYTDFAWEVMYGQMLEQAGFQTRQLWSVNWWKQPGQEARRLAGELLRPAILPTE